ncbi:4-(cytidine 5'-diphospho)-2-C-methyl-D-erythritol kinase [Catenovulum sp. SM1970]|uniref:4-(cytidine 5'-diphospho)-2-C-methyl-D-erythritol kinase n=1 Tax=Marinifaba aquimaris TaxID=2741323 RepID=UPI001572C4AB|nr:4-(cytidine 5'-diphospho)-2-C-methyl-D-erythritol kinase [Marinifaba aquimaris]
MQYRCPSPAKINWFLHITNRRQDGYHELQTLFQFVDLNDYLTFELRNDDKIALTGDLAGVSAEQNLIYQAALALQHISENKCGININVEKNIPTGAGLGGGSSNAATCLLMLNKLWKLNFSLPHLAEIGLSLGADVPIFVYGFSAFAEGVGENLLKAELTQPHLLLAMPKETHISTAAIFTDPDLKRNCEKIALNDYHFENTTNVCQPIAAKRYNFVAKTLSWLVEYAPSRMTGTGACCFAVFQSVTELENCLNHKPEYVDCFSVKAMNTSSCHQYIAKQFN